MFCTVLCFALFSFFQVETEGRRKRTANKTASQRYSGESKEGRERKQTNKQKKTKQKPHPPKTSVNCLGSPCCQGSRPWPAPAGGKSRWEADTHSPGYFGLPQPHLEREVSEVSPCGRKERKSPLKEGAAAPNRSHRLLVAANTPVTTTSFFSPFASVLRNYLHLITISGIIIINNIFFTTGIFFSSLV